MGSLTVPSSGLVYFDTNPVTYSVEKISRIGYSLSQFGGRPRQGPSKLSAAI